MELVPGAGWVPGPSRSEHSQEWSATGVGGACEGRDRLAIVKKSPASESGRYTEIRGLRFLGWSGESGLGAAYVFEVIVGAYRDGVFAGTEFAQREFVVLFEGVADVAGRRD